MKQQRAGRRLHRLIGWFAGVALISGVAVGPPAVARAATKPAGATTSDARIQPIATKVEQLRGLKFEHPIPVDFLDDVAFEKRIAVDKGKLSAQDKRDIERAQSQLRAVGLIRNDVDIVDASSDLQTSGVLAYYDPKTKKITVKGTTTDDVAIRVTLAHELTHALQDQHFGLAKLEKAAAKAHASSALHTLVEGDAVRIQRAYADSLPDSDQAAYRREEAAQSATAQAEITASGVPESLAVLFEAPYDFGPVMVDAVIAERHAKGVDALFRNPPTSDSAYLTPSTLFDGTKFTTIDPPKLLAGEKRSGKPDIFGAFALYLVLASRIDPATALTAADAWHGDAMVTFTRAGTEAGKETTCLRTAIVGRTRAGTRSIGDALSEWAAAMPAGAAEVDARADRVTLTACDPGAAATEAPNRAVAALVFAATRDGLFLEIVKQGLAVPVAVCASDTLIRDPVFAPIIDSTVNDPSGSPDAAALSAVRAVAPGIVQDCLKSAAV